MVKLKVFSAASFAECEGPFNQWMAEHPGIQIVNISFNNGESKREITLLYATEAPKAQSIAVPILSYPQRRN